MKFEYINYDGSLIEGLEKDPSIIYVFSDYALKNSQRIASKRNIFEPDPLYLTMDEFKEKIFKTDRIILSEAKRFVSLYNVMKKEFEDLQINSYFESMEFADKFFKYYTELNRSLCKNEIELEKWQERYFEIFKKFKEKYQNYLDRRNYIPKDWVENIDNLYLEDIKKYKKIIFVDVISFTPLDKYVLRELAKELDITFKLQVKKGDFDEEDLELIDISLPENNKMQINILEVQDDFETIGNLMNLASEKSEENITFNIYSPEADTNDYFKTFPDNFIREGFFTINDTKFYKLLEAQSELISSIEIKLDNLIPIDKFLEGISIFEVREYYNIGKEDIKELYNLIDMDYKYIGEESNEKITEVYRDIIKLSEMKTIDEFITYFNKLLSLESLRETIYKNLYDKLQEYMGYAKTTEIMLEEKELKRCFKNGGEILKFLLQYFNSVEITRNDSTTEKLMIKSIDKCKVAFIAKESIFINVSSRNIPKLKRDQLNLTEKQKKENGFTYYEKERKEEKYRFYQAILKNNKNTILYIRNENSGEGISPVLSEILDKYKVIKLEKIILTEDVLGKLLEFQGKRDIIQRNNINLPKRSVDFVEKKLNLGAYDFETLTGCEYRFYLEKVAKIYPVESDVNLGISLKFLGIYVHDIFEKLTDKMWKKILNLSDYYIDKNEVEELLKRSFYLNRKKIPIYLDNYFLEILIPRFTKNILRFYKEIEKLYIEKKVTRIESEKNSSRSEVFLKGDVDVILGGRVDLVVETPNSNHVIDFKTGSKIDKQLDFYSIMLYGDETKADKSIYNAFEGEFETQKKIKLTKEQLKEALIEFFKTSEYQISNKKSKCMYCNYEELCRREF